MASLVPKGVPIEAWTALPPHRDFAVLCGPADPIFMKFGPGAGLVISIEPAKDGRAVNTIDFETGSPTVVAPFPFDTVSILGRTSDASIKLVNPIISRQHVQLTLTGNVLLVRDLGSTNKTYLLEEIKHFDVATYLEEHPLDKAQGGTLDWVHEEFGVAVNDFLKNYSQTTKENN